MPRLGIKERILFLALFPVLIISVVLFMYFTNIHLQELRDSLVGRGLSITENMAPASEYGVVTGNVELLKILAAPIIDNSEVVSLSIYGKNREPLIRFGENGFWDKGFDEGRQICSENDKSILFCQPIYLTQLDINDYSDDSKGLRKHEVIGWIYLEMTKSYNDKKSTKLLVKSAFLTLISLFLASALALVVSHQFTHSLASLIDAVKRIKEGDLAVDIEVTERSEIGTLQSGFNAMVNSMRSAQTELKERIDDVTAHWQNALQQLEGVNKDLMEQKEKSQQANRAKSRFLATMSHEIRTPLSGLLGMLSILKTTNLDEVQSEYIKNIDYSAMSLRALVDDVLDFSRIEAGKLTIQENEFNLRTVINEITAMLAPTAHAKNIEYICDFDPEVCGVVIGDSVRLRQVLINLLSNAIKFTDYGNVILRVTRLEPSDANNHLIRFEVEDTGIGIDEEHQDNIFESFTQVDNTSTRKYAGTGLGTAISRELVKLMGGKIGLYSQLGRGSKFWIELPLGLGDCEQDEVSQYRHVNILLVEKNAESRKAIYREGEALGVNFECLESEERLAVMLSGKAQYDMIIFAENSMENRYTDTAMLLKENGQLSYHPPFVHLAYYNSSGDIAVFDAQIYKPLTSASLKSLIDRYVLHVSAKADQDRIQSEEVIGSLTILIVEDDPINSKVLCYLLERMGHKVHRAVNGAEALDKMCATSLDMVFMDMRMPEMDGPTVTEKWRLLEGGKSHLPIVALTANVTTEDQAICSAAGMDGFVSKPVDTKKITEVLKQLGFN